jgi:hypothetical protein
MIACQSQISTMHAVEISNCFSKQAYLPFFCQFSLLHTTVSLVFTNQGFRFSELWFCNAIVIMILWCDWVEHCFCHKWLPEGSVLKEPDLSAWVEPILRRTTFWWKMISWRSSTTLMRSSSEIGLQQNRLTETAIIVRILLVNNCVDCFNGLSLKLLI